MTRYDNLMERLRGGEYILIDGGTGTEVERRGVPQLDNAWNGGAALSHPDILRDIHEDYIREGAEIIISNTFASTRHALQDAGEANSFADYNRRGVELAREARDNAQAGEVVVAGGISYWSWTGNHPPLEVLERDVSEQAAVMKDAGADLLMLEMMADIDRMLCTLCAAQSSGLPVWVGLSCAPAEDGNMRLLSGESIEAALTVLAERHVPLVSIMHTDVQHIDACLDIFDTHWNGLVGVYAHSGDYAEGKWIFESTISPEDYATACRRWMARGVRLIGGCCGICPSHIHALHDVV